MFAELAYDPASIRTVTVTGNDLTPAEVVAVARHRARVILDERAMARVQRTASTVEELVRAGSKVYGLTTGFGSLRDVAIDPSDVRLLQHNLVRSHAAGVGDPLGEDVVRAMMLLRLNTLLAGHSGIRPTTLERLARLLNSDVFPYVPSHGSVGASGDLAPLAHLALVVVGDPAGMIHAGPKRAPARRGDYVEKPLLEEFHPLAEGVLEQACGLGPHELAAKEGLALTNGTQLMTALGTLALYDAFVAVEAALAAAAASVEAIKGCVQAFDPRVAAVRRMPEQAEVAACLLRLMQGSAILSSPASLPFLGRARARVKSMLHGERSPLLEGLEPVLVELERAAEAVARGHAPTEELLRASSGIASLIPRLVAEGRRLEGTSFAQALCDLASVVPATPRVQDDYSFRCTPQVLGAALWGLRVARGRLESELNAVTDNPLLFSSDDGTPTVLSGGNFHGQPVAMAMDVAAMAASEVASLAERRCAKLLDPAFNAGLPAQLVPRSGLNSGFMLAQYTAAALVAESKLLSHPASVDSIPTCASTEDHVSMGPLSGLKLRRVVENLEQVVGIELLLACQALDLWRPLRPGRGVAAVWEAVRACGVPFVDQDVPLYELMDRCARLVRSGGIRAALAHAFAEA